MADRQVRYFFRNKQVSGATNLPSDAFVSEPFVDAYEGKLYFKGASGGNYVPVYGYGDFFEVGSNVSNLNVESGITIGSLFAITGSTGQIINYGGITNLDGYFLSGTSNGFVLGLISDIQSTGGTPSSATKVQPGLNTYTGGTDNYPTVNVSAATLNSLSVSGATSLGIVSATTIFSGSTNLYDIFSTGSGTKIQPGLNTYTGGTSNYPTVNISAATLNNLSVSGATLLGIVSATTIDANFILSGGTNLYDIFFNTSGGTIQGGGYPIQPGLNIYTGGTYSSQTVNMSAATLNYLSATSISSSTVNSNLVLSAGTDLYDIFELKGSIPSPNSYFPSGW